MTSLIFPPEVTLPCIADSLTADILFVRHCADYIQISGTVVPNGRMVYHSCRAEGVNSGYRCRWSDYDPVEPCTRVAQDNWVRRPKVGPRHCGGGSQAATQKPIPVMPNEIKPLQ
jgi:hypothetical protein